MLPPLAPWEGRSAELLVVPDAPWATPFERQGLDRTPSYDETVAWLERLAAAAPQIEIVSLGTVVVENHSLKPYRRRVLGTRLLLESALRTLGEHGAELRRAAAADRARRPDPLPLAWKVGGEPGRNTLPAIEQQRVESAVTGGAVTRWTGRPVTLEVPLLVMSQPAASAAAPAALPGRLGAGPPGSAPRPAGGPAPQASLARLVLPVGLLPRGAEAHRIRRGLRDGAHRREHAADAALAAEFRSALEADAELAADPAARLDWFYRRTPWFDERWNLCPVAREPLPR